MFSLRFFAVLCPCSPMTAAWIRAPWKRAPGGKCVAHGMANLRLSVQIDKMPYHFAFFCRSILKKCRFILHFYASATPPTYTRNPLHLLNVSDMRAESVELFAKKIRGMGNTASFGTDFLKSAALFLKFAAEYSGKPQRFGGNRVQIATKCKIILGNTARGRGEGRFYKLT